ncbi:ferritin family protein [Micromonospora cathayae]|uniref:Ferritin family protein n=1 Tax=Micromonospora cathayae TaxID=3028804 RepID=A0ABY7ZQS8_9ACTN|nr:ferritin family protein [Micromonospora sp. HUAS 3]WDZ85307.1 ferritin family protein [Micromonospora sp. HUAS 3]
MRVATGIAAVAVGAVFGAGLAVPVEAAAPRLDPETRADTLAAMTDEAYAYASYRAYAQEAARRGQAAVARLFGETAREEFNDHFVAEARLIGFVRGNQANLTDSIEGETHEATELYPSFAEQATRDGCPEVTAHYAEFAGDELVHAGRFTTALTALRFPDSGIEVPTGEPVPPVPIERTRPACGGQTLENLRDTLYGEAFAWAKYTMYSRHADRTGQQRLAELWTNTAGQELGEHFAETAMLAGLVGTTAANLRTAVAAEVEAAATYQVYANRAAKAGDIEAAKLFEEIRHDELRHAAAFRRALVDLTTAQSPRP